MKYEEFRSVWTRALRDSGLPTIGWPTETIDLSSTDRNYQNYLEPYSSQDATPFHVAASLEFTWHALQTARAASTEEDLLTELFGREEAQDLDTEQPWVRIDVKLNASLEPGKAIPMPSNSGLREWANEVTARLARIEPLIPEDSVQQAPGGALLVRGWTGDPKLHVVCTAEGVLKLEGVELVGWKAIQIPREWGDIGRSDDAPDEQLGAMFTRLKLALQAWTESLDHLRPVKVKWWGMEVRSRWDAKHLTSSTGRS